MSKVDTGRFLLALHNGELNFFSKDPYYKNPFEDRFILLDTKASIPYVVGLRLDRSFALRTPIFKGWYEATYVRDGSGAEEQFKWLTFEEVFELVPEEVKGELLFNLDILNKSYDIKNFRS